MTEKLTVGKIDQLTITTVPIEGIGGFGEIIAANPILTTIYDLGGFVINPSSNTISWQNRVLTTDKEIVEAMIKLIEERKKQSF